MADVEHTIGLLLGTEDDWPRAYEALLRRLGAVTGRRRARPTAPRSVRVTIEPFNLRDKPRHDLVIDRLAYWYYHPREWLKKIALMDDVYLLNSPFTFQSMEKHAAYCAMMRLGLKVPETVLVPFKNPLDNSRCAYTSARYNQPFDLDALAESVGYPMFMKPYDGGAWVGVSKIRNSDELHAAYDASGERLMHLQAAVEDYDVFARSLTIGPETMVMKFRPELPMHDRYAVDHDFLDRRRSATRWSPSRGWSTRSSGGSSTPASRWSRGTEVHPIDYANACPDVAVTSLHYYFPWAMSALLRWTVFCVVTGRKPRLDTDTAALLRDRRRPVAVVRREARRIPPARRRLLRDRAVRGVLRQAPVARRRDGRRLGRLARSSARCCARRSAATYPAHEHDRFLAHFGGLIDAWLRDHG